MVDKKNMRCFKSEVATVICGITGALPAMYNPLNDGYKKTAKTEK